LTPPGRSVVFGAGASHPIGMDQPRTVLVLGASGALGGAVAARFAQAGHPLVLAGRSHPETEASFEAVDLADPASIRDFATRVEIAYPAVSIVVNCSGDYYKGPFAEISPEALERLLATNFTGPVLLTRLLLPLLRRNAPADIVQITSISAATMLSATTSSVPHIAAKAGLHAFGATLGREFSSEGVRITSIAPGTFAKNGHAGIPLEILADEIFIAVSRPSGVHVESVTLRPSGFES
jgi:NAD(P)-dependent dehydrogenase (short-subunit alcohol dehydrogenase family)